MNLLDSGGRMQLPPTLVEKCLRYVSLARMYILLVDKHGCIAPNQALELFIISYPTTYTARAQAANKNYTT
jgi:hypothetical protein